MFPKPEPKGEDKDSLKYGQMYEAYREWVDKEFGGGDREDNDNNFFDQSQSTTVSEISSNLSS